MVQSAEVIIHAAARNIIESTTKPLTDFEVNIGGTLNVLMATRDFGSGRRVVYTSSASVYGNAPRFPVDEKQPASNLTPYSVSKYASENYCRVFHHLYGVPSTILRYSNVYGPPELPSDPFCGVVAIFLGRAMAGEPLTICGDGNQTRDFTYMDDVVNATLLAASRRNEDVPVYNVGTGYETSIRQLAALIVRLTGSPSATMEIDRRDIDSVSRRAVSIDRIRDALGWAPAVGLDEGLRRTYEWLSRRPVEHAPAADAPRITQAGLVRT
jgi:UDP-glucose 4-epimerase